MNGFVTGPPVKLVDWNVKDSEDHGTVKPLEGVLVTIDVTKPAAFAEGTSGADH